MPVVNTPWKAQYLVARSYSKVGGSQPPPLHVGVSDSADVLVNSLEEQVLDRTY